MTYDIDANSIHYIIRKTQKRGNIGFRENFLLPYVDEFLCFGVLGNRKITRS